MGPHNTVEDQEYKTKNIGGMAFCVTQGNLATLYIRSTFSSSEKYT